MNNDLNILVVSEKASFQEEVYKDISALYSVEFLTPGEIKTVSHKHDLVLIDLVGMDDLVTKFCLNIQKDSSRYTPIIFLGYEDSLDAHMYAYEKGADEYIVKPVVQKLFTSKVNIYAKTIHRVRNLNDDYRQAQKVAMDAIAGGNELGQVMKFVERAHNSITYEDLAEHVFIVSNALELNCCLTIRVDDEEYSFSSSGEIKKLEQEVLRITAVKQQRFRDFGKRTIITYPNASLLVKNMPLDDIERYGRIKDALPVMLAALDSKISSLRTELLIQFQTQELAHSFEDIKSSFTYLNELVEKNIQRSNKTMRSMLFELNDSLPEMGLEDDQESYILNSIEGAIESSIDIIDISRELDEVFSGIRSHLQFVVEKQDKLLASVFEKHVQNQNEAQNPVMDDVELF